MEIVLIQNGWPGRLVASALVVYYKARRRAPTESKISVVNINLNELRTASASVVLV